MADNSEIREKVRGLVREVLRAVPAEGETVERYPKHLRVNSLKDDVPKEFDRDESAKQLITEDDLRGLETGSRIRISEKAKLTPLAVDIVKEKGIELVKKKERDRSLKVGSVAIGCDHGGFEMKTVLCEYLKSLGLQVRDFGTDSKNAVDYPDYAHAVGLAVSRNQAEVGILIDGAGIGSAMAANKVPGVLAAACYNPALAKNSREHNGANVLSLGSGQNSLAEVKEIVLAFLSNEIEEPRHKKRVAKIVTIEKQYKNQS